jgi:hypothetical protein
MKNALRLIIVISLLELVALHFDTIIMPRRVPLNRILPERVLQLTTIEEHTNIKRAVRSFPGTPYFSTALVLAILALSIFALRKANKDQAISN